jgi:hypothetical protein
MWTGDVWSSEREKKEEKMYSVRERRICFKLVSKSIVINLITVMQGSLLCMYET